MSSGVQKISQNVAVRHNRKWCLAMDCPIAHYQHVSRVQRNTELRVSQCKAPPWPQHQHTRRQTPFSMELIHSALPRTFSVLTTISSDPRVEDADNRADNFCINNLQDHLYLIWFLYLAVWDDGGSKGQLWVTDARGSSHSTAKVPPVEVLSEALNPACSRGRCILPLLTGIYEKKILSLPCKWHVIWVPHGLETALWSTPEWGGFNQTNINWNFRN